MSKVSLLFGIHCHQPVDNFSHVIDEATQKCYKPFLEVANRFPNFKYAVHYSGWLLEYLQKNQKGTFKLLQEAARNGSIEFFSGGYYEPILASIPSRDRVGQITKLNKFIKKNFSCEPRGLWLTERVWDSSIIEDVANCGIEYVIVDDYHFMSAGYKEERLKGYYVTEEGGVSVKIFPISKELRYRMPFRAASEAVGYIESLSGADAKNAAVIFDDGEKFGVWPNTFDWVYNKEWLKLFIEGVERSSTIETQHYGEYVDGNKPLGIAYLPITSYYEMGEWSLEAQDTIEVERLQKLAGEHGHEEGARRFVKGGIWKNFLVKYPESNRIHKRVLELSIAKTQIKDKEYEDNLYRAQTNDVLWHGVFGGLYLPNLRDNAWRFIVNCENIRYADVKSDTVEIADSNMDGYNEAKMVSKSLVMTVDEKCGGAITEILLRDAGFNLQNTLARRKEAYHYKIEQAVHAEETHEKCQDESSGGIDSIHDVDAAKLAEYRDILKFDWHERNSLISHITDFGLSIDNFEHANYKEYGDFANKPFSITKLSDNSVSIVREGGIYGDRRYNTKLTKILALKGNRLNFSCRIESECHYDLQYLLEFNLHFANLANVKISNKKLEDKMVLDGIKSLSIKDAYTQKNINFRFEQSVRAYLFRVETVSQSESGFDLTNQGLAIGFALPFCRYLQSVGEMVIGE